MNVSGMERVVSTALGGTLLVRSLGRRSLAGMAIALPLLYRGLRGHSYLYGVLGVNTAETGFWRALAAPARGPEVEHWITVGKSADELYRLWREPQSLSRIMGDRVVVTAADGNRTHWWMQGPLGRSLEWEAALVEDRPGELLRWKSLEGAALPNEGTVRFRPAPGDRGTETALRFRFDLPGGGALASRAARRLGIVPDVLAERALRRFKSLAETGEVPTLERNPSARGGADTW